MSQPCVSYRWGGGGAKVRCFAQKHNKMTLIRARNQTARDPEWNTLADWHRSSSRSSDCHYMSWWNQCDFDSCLSLLLWRSASLPVYEKLWDFIDHHRTLEPNATYAIEKARRTENYAFIWDSAVRGAAWAVQHPDSYWKVGGGNVSYEPKRPIRPEFIPVSVAWTDC